METPRDDSADRRLADAARGDAATQLLQQYLPRLRAFVRAHLGVELRRRESDSDIVQSVCRELLEHRDSLTYQAESQFRGWLFTTALNKVREKVRFHHQPRRSLAREVQPDSQFSAADQRSSAGASHAAREHERMANLEAALDRLDDSEREVICLARLAELPMAEVAERLGKSEVAARKQLGRALLRLANELERGAQSSESSSEPSSGP